ncbi:MAG: EamA family transporter [Mangrovibacterium sp.]
MPNQDTLFRLKIVLSFAAIYIVWGSTYMAIMVALRSFPPFLLAGLRFLTAGLIMFGWCWFRKEKMPTLHDVFKLSVTGILLLFFGTGAVVWVEQYITSSLASIVISTVPIWFVVLDKPQWSFHLSNKMILLGLIMGFAGVILLLGDRSLMKSDDKSIELLSFFILLGGTLMWATGSLFSRYYPANGSPILKASIQMIAAGILAILTGAFTGELSRVESSSVTGESLFAMIYLITMGSMVAYLAYTWLIQVSRPSLVGTYAYVNPLVAVLLGWLILGEQVTSRQIVALFVILSGIFIINASKFNFLLRPGVIRKR